MLTAPLPQHTMIATQSRGPIVESVHYGSVVVVDGVGERLVTVGDPEAIYYPRSALKPLQLVAMMYSGLELEDELLAIATSSHSGSSRHLDGVTRILHRYGLTPDQLRNTPDLPYGASEKAEWLREGRPSERLPQNCSGKHAAMLATCVINDWDTDSYLDQGHPLQQVICRTVAELCEEDISAVSVDGCGAPVFAVTLPAIASAYGRLASAPDSTPQGAVARAMRAYPELVSGEGRDVAAVMRAYPGLLAKEGAEGVQLFGLPDGVGVAVKIADGSDRARMAVAIRALQHVGTVPKSLADLAASPVLGGGEPVGELKALHSWGPRVPDADRRATPRAADRDALTIASPSESPKTMSTAPDEN